MKRIYFILIVLATCFISAEGATMVKSKNNCHCHRSHKTNNFYTRSNQERLNDIEFKLDILKDKYKRDKKRLEYSTSDKYDLKIRQKELKYKYQKEEIRLKAERKAIKQNTRR